MGYLHYRLSVKTKMLVVLSVGIVGFSVYFAINHFILNSHGQVLEQAVRQQLPAMELTDVMRNRMFLLRDAATNTTVSQNFESLGIVDRNHKEILASFQHWEEKGLPQLEEILLIQADYKLAYTQLNEIIQNIVSGLAPLSQVKDSFKNAIAKIIEIEVRVEKIKQGLNNELNEAMAATEKMSNRGRAAGLVILLCAFAMAGLFYWVMSGINQSLNQTNVNLQSTSRRLLDMVGEAQVSATQLRETAFRQASSSTETVVSMEEMKRLLSQTSRTSSNAVHHSEASFKEANDGKGMVQSLRDAMTEIGQSNTELEEVTAVVKQIRERTNVINEIVFKTQMLSFNANIEAARAGQHGLGFAVVATEMGNLAEMSGKAAQQINELLDRSLRKVESTVSRTKEKIEKGNELAASCYEFFKLLTDRAGQLKEFVNSISSAAAEQNSGVDYVVNAMNDLNNTAAESDRMAQGLSSLSDGLKSEALGLASAVDNLNELVNGRKKSDPPPPSAPTASADADVPVIPMRESA